MESKIENVKEVYRLPLQMEQYLKVILWFIHLFYKEYLNACHMQVCVLGQYPRSKADQLLPPRRLHGGTRPCGSCLDSDSSHVSYSLINHYMCPSFTVLVAGKRHVYNTKGKVVICEWKKESDLPGLERCTSIGWETYSEVHQVLLSKLIAWKINIVNTVFWVLMIKDDGTLSSNFSQITWVIWGEASCSRQHRE